MQAARNEQQEAAASLVGGGGCLHVRDFLGLLLADGRCLCQAILSVLRPKHTNQPMDRLQPSRYALQVTAHSSPESVQGGSEQGRGKRFKGEKTCRRLRASCCCWVTRSRSVEASLTRDSASAIFLSQGASSARTSCIHTRHRVTAGTLQASLSRQRSTLVTPLGGGEAADLQSLLQLLHLALDALVHLLYRLQHQDSVQRCFLPAYSTPT